METSVFSLLVRNNFGVLAKISSQFSRRACNISSLTVYETRESGISHMVVTLAESEEKVRQIYGQLEKLEDVVQVSVLKHDRISNKF
jgi:acetolactate synthase-1/3 small subunit